MNAMERLLQEDLDHLIDRLAAASHEGLAAGCASRRPDLLGQLADSETRLTNVRRSLIEGYAVWREALQECADLWALVDLMAEPAAEGDRRAA